MTYVSSSAEMVTTVTPIKQPLILIRFLSGTNDATARSGVNGRLGVQRVQNPTGPRHRAGCRGTRHGATVRADENRLRLVGAMARRAARWPRCRRAKTCGRPAPGCRPPRHYEAACDAGVVSAVRTLIGPRRGVRWFVAGYAGVSGFLALEPLVRQPDDASELHASDDDARSTRGIIAAFLLAIVSAPLLRRLPVRPLPWPCAPFGLLVLLAGLALRAWSMQTLNDAYTRTLRVTNQQTVTDRGPYRHIRHPGYLGSLLVWCGFALASGSVVVVGTVAALLVPPYVHRIGTEEELLARQLPGYDEYRGRTTRLVPRVW